MGIPGGSGNVWLFRGHLGSAVAWGDLGSQKAVAQTANLAFALRMFLDPKQVITFPENASASETVIRKTF